MRTHRQVEEVAATWLSRQTDAGWSSIDEVELQVWLDASPAHAAAYWRLEHCYSALDQLSGTTPLSGGPGQLFLDATTDEPEQEPKRNRLWAIFDARSHAAIAATLVGAIVITLLVWATTRHQAGPLEMYSTVMGQVAKVQLQDGSLISLDAETQIRVMQSGTERTLWLDRGQAYLEVAHDTARPFKVLAGDGEVVVVGTKFMVSRAGSEAEVAVLEGKVLLEQTNVRGAGHLALTPGDIGRTHANTLVLRTSDLTQLRNRLAWQSGMVIFDDTPLEQAIAEFNRYNQRKIRILNADARRMPIGGSFKLGNVEGFARLLKQAYGLQVEIGSDEITIS